LNELIYIKNRIDTASKILTDSKTTAFFFVLTSEEMVIQDTLKAADLFRKFNVPIRGYVVNRIVPDGLLAENIPEYLRNRILTQKELLKKIESQFRGQILAQVPEFDRDVKGLEMIGKVAERLFGE